MVQKKNHKRKLDETRMFYFINNVFAVGYILCLVNSVFAETRLPDLPPPNDQISSQDQVLIKKFVFEGNTIFSDEHLSEIAIGYENISMGIEKIHELRNKITKLYIEAGYINSGVMVKDQTVTDGMLIMTIVEGTVAKIHVNGKRRLRDRYIHSRIHRGITTPANIFKLQKPLQLLQKDVRIQTIHAQLTAGVEPGEGILNINVIEDTPYQLGFVFNNYRSPSTGSYRGQVYGSYSNVTGWGEIFSGRYGLTEGADDFDLSFSLPLTRWETELLGSYQENDSTIITDVFRDLDIDSKSEIFNLTLRQPLYNRLNREFSVFLSLDRKKSKTFVLSKSFSLSQGVVDGVSKITILNVGQEYVDRNQTRVLALRSNLGFGMDWFDATVKEPSDPMFITWLAQAQYLTHIPLWNAQVLLRSALRVTSDELPPLEKFGIGGRDTVRGYRENAFTGDNGLISSIEFRFPITKIKIPNISNTVDDGQVQLIPFFDYGRVWNESTDENDDQDLFSIGFGVRWSPSENISAEIFWGQKLKNIGRDIDYDLQDEGIHLQISAVLF